MTAVNIDQASAHRLLADAAARAATVLGLSYTPLTQEASGVRAIDIAGLIRLAPALELEIAPKFLGLDAAHAGWREDFFFLATLSKHGRLLTSERLSASSGAPRDLATLVARSITTMYDDLKRRPLRSYRRHRETDFYLDGDPDPVDLVFPSPDGYAQDVTRFDRRNPWNADITAAARALLPEVRDPSAASLLVRLIEDIGPQAKPATRRAAIPSRHRAWKPLHELSMDVLRGLGMSLEQGHSMAPGYIVNTWRVWEDLVTTAARIGFGTALVRPQPNFALGTRVRSGGRASRLNVVPDCVIQGEGLRPRMLLDAKYKGHVEKGQLRISEQDVYEALAFSRATGCNLVALAYPAPPTGGLNPVGACTLVERVNVDSVQIVGVQVEVRRVAKVGGLREFASNFAAGLSNAFA